MKTVLRQRSDDRSHVAGTAVIVFAKSPVPGHAKTRLIPVLGADGAAGLARRMLEQAVAAAAEAGVGPVEICATPDCSDPLFASLSERHGATLATQGTGDLGVRMNRALKRALRASASALLLGTDIPALDAAAIRSAAMALSSSDAVFVPALDGGYGLVGLKRPLPALFVDMPWSTGSVMALTRSRARTLGLQLAELPPLPDIDSPDDLVQLPPTWRALLAPLPKP